MVSANPTEGSASSALNHSLIDLQFYFLQGQTSLVLFIEFNSMGS